MLPNQNAPEQLANHVQIHAQRHQAACKVVAHVVPTEIPNAGILDARLPMKTNKTTIGDSLKTVTNAMLQFYLKPVQNDSKAAGKSL